MNELFASILFGGLGGAALTWLFRSWISERLRQSIQHEYSQKLENHKTDLNMRIQAIQHENQLQQLRTSLFFDHQRNAFAGILTKIAQVNQAWIDKCFVYDEGFSGAVPLDSFRELQAEYYAHQLFLDSSCRAAMALVFDCFTDTFPVEGEDVDDNVCEKTYKAIEYLQPRIGELFQNRIGVVKSSEAEREIALYGAICLINRYSFADADIPPKGTLKLTRRDQPADAVIKAKANMPELVLALKGLINYINREGGSFNDASLKATSFLSMLSSK